MTTRLSDLLRLSLEQAGNERVPLQSEIRFAKLYAGIQQMRFSDRLTFEWDVDERALEAAVPAMLLQPLIENAVEHGLSRAGEPGRIRLAVEREGDRLRMTVRDNGPGPPTDGGDPGVGLDNTRKRLSTMYGDAAAITLVSDTEGGARVTIELPFEEAL